MTDLTGLRNILDEKLSQSAAVRDDFFARQSETLIAVAEAVAKSLEAGGCVLFFGNGGSAADSQHIAAEFVNRLLVERRALPALALTTDTSVLTSIANDRGYDEVFTRQIEALGRPGDVAWGISTSGASPSVVLALEKARRMGLVTVALTGGDGGAAGRAAEYHLNAGASKVSSRIQETHILALHLMCELVDERLFGSPGAP